MEFLIWCRGVSLQSNVGFFSQLRVIILNLNSVNSLLLRWINIPLVAWEYGIHIAIASSVIRLSREGLVEYFLLASTSPNSTYFIMFTTVTTCFKVTNNSNSKRLRRNIHPKAECRIKQYLWEISGNILFFSRFTWLIVIQLLYFLWYTNSWSSMLNKICLAY